MIIRKTDISLLKEAEKDGLTVSMTIIRKSNESELNKELGAYFKRKVPGYLGTFDEEDAEEVLDSLNEYLLETENVEKKLAYPLTGGADVHLIRITENLLLKVLIVDEYYCNGESETYIMSDVFIINEHTTTNDVDVLIDFIQNYFG